MHRAQTRLPSPAHGAGGRPPPRDGQQPALAMTARNRLSVATHRLLARSEPFRRPLFLIPVSLGRGTRRSPHLRWHVPRPCPVARASPPSTPASGPGTVCSTAGPGGPVPAGGPGRTCTPIGLRRGHHIGSSSPGTQVSLSPWLAGPCQGCPHSLQRSKVKLSCPPRLSLPPLPASFHAHIFPLEGFMWSLPPSFQCHFCRPDPHPDIREPWDGHVASRPVLQTLL